MKRKVIDREPLEGNLAGAWLYRLECGHIAFRVPDPTTGKDPSKRRRLECLMCLGGVEPSVNKLINSGQET